MKYIYSLLVYALSIVITLYIFPMSISYSRVSDTIEIKTLLTKSDHMVTSLNFQKTNITLARKIRFVQIINALINSRKPP